MKTYYVYKETFLIRLFKILFPSKKNMIMYWERNKGDAAQYIPFPDNSQLYSLLPKSRSHLETYYSNVIPHHSDPHLKNYIKKRVSYIFSDYFFFRTAASMYAAKSKNDYVIVGPKYLRNIFENKSGFTFLINIVSYISYFSSCFTRCFWLVSYD